VSVSVCVSVSVLSKKLNADLYIYYIYRTSNASIDLCVLNRYIKGIVIADETLVVAEVRGSTGNGRVFCLCVCVYVCVCVCVCMRYVCVCVCFVICVCVYEVYIYVCVCVFCDVCVCVCVL